MLAKKEKKNSKKKKVPNVFTIFQVNISLLVDRGGLSTRKVFLLTSASDNGKKTSQSGSGARRSLSPPNSRPRKQMEHRCENSRVGVGKTSRLKLLRVGKDGEIPADSSFITARKRRGQRGGRI